MTKRRQPKGEPDAGEYWDKMLPRGYSFHNPPNEPPEIHTGRIWAVITIVIIAVILFSLLWKNSGL